MNSIDPRVTALVLSRMNSRHGSACRQLVRGGLALSDPLRIVAECPELADAVRRSRLFLEAESSLKRWEEQGIFSVSLQCPRYPRRLRFHPKAPLLMYLRGDPAALPDDGERTPTVALVGSRHASPRGCELATQFARELRDYGVCIISGLALGIDGAAHQGALQGSLRGDCPTIAVLGNGLHSAYPATHRGLARRIVEQGGLLVSTYEPGTPPLPAHFLERNGIIAYLSRAVIVVQAALRSGALSTARWALEAGGEIMAVPGAVGDLRHAGTHQLIRDGAHLVTSAADIAAVLGIATATANGRTDSAPSTLRAIFEQHGAVLPLSLLLGDVGRLSLAELVAFEFEGIISFLPGDLVRLN